MAEAQRPLFTCISCSIAFHSAEEQRAHYRSDFHRYNMKRRVAGLPPVNASAFNEKVLERRAETAIAVSPIATTCTICGKYYGNENSYKSHLQSKKHKENELKAKTSPPPISTTQQKPTATESLATDISTKLAISEAIEGDDEAALEAAIDAKISLARARISPNSCLFCSSEAQSFEDNLTHMSSAHSFFVPDAEYLTDVKGLMAYLGEKIAVGNFCIFCNSEFRSLHAVRNHMLDKSHCKIAYDREKHRLEISDFYDFSSSYPDYDPNLASTPEKSKSNEEWEDVEEESDDDDDADEIVDESSSDSDSEESLPDNQLTYGDTPYELVLPSGARIGHRSMKRYYAQSFAPSYFRSEDPNSSKALVRKLLQDKNSALVPVRGGFGSFGAGTQVVKARNVGEAREAGRHIKEFRDQKRKEDYKTRVAYVQNHQKHFRDPNRPGGGS